MVRIGLLVVLAVGTAAPSASVLAASAAVPLTNDTLSVVDFAWSPVSQDIVFVRLEDDGSQTLLRLSGGTTVELAHSPVASRVQWSADGSLILASLLDPGQEFRTYALSAVDGSIVYQSEPNRVAARFGDARSPSQVVALSKVDETTRRVVIMDLVAHTEVAVSPPGPALFLPALRVRNSVETVVHVAPDTAGFLRLAEQPGGAILTACDSCDIVAFDVSAADGSVVYAKPVGTKPIFSQIFKLDPLNVEHQMTFDLGDHLEPVFSEDGAWIVYSREDTESRNTHRIPAQGGSVEALTAGTDARRLAKLSADGTQLAYLQLEGDDAGEYWRLWMKPAETAVVPVMGRWGLLLLVVLQLGIGLEVLRRLRVGR